MIYSDDISYRGKLFLQFTGLKDKNDKEIYEGDLVRFVFGEIDCVGVCAWDKYLGLKFDKGGWTSLVGVDRFGEVVGNIFENPELWTHDEKAAKKQVDEERASNLRCQVCNEPAEFFSGNTGGGVSAISLCKEHFSSKLDNSE
jgi:hypothetical protein